ncbi:Histone-lysine N-methyltransferase SETMAR, partial [Harpegnathos saltator]
FRICKSSYFDLKDEDHAGRPQEMSSNDLEALLQENSIQSSVELAKRLYVNQSTVIRRLHEKWKILKEGKWVPHELLITENAIASRVTICLSLLNRRKHKSFSYRIATESEKWIY